MISLKGVLLAGSKADWCVYSAKIYNFKALSAYPRL